MGTRVHRLLWPELLACLVLFLSLSGHVPAAQPGVSIVPALQDQFGLSESQVKGALGALLVFVRERLSKPAFDDLAETIPNAEYIMQQVKQNGIVTGPLDNIGDYEQALVTIGIGQPLASEFAPAVVKQLGAAGHIRQRDILAGVLN